MMQRSTWQPQRAALYGLALAYLAVALPTEGRAQTFSSYVCTGNFYSFNATYAANGDTVLLELQDGSRVELRIAVSGSGSRYVGAGYELHSKGTTALLQLPNATQMTCNEQTGGGQVTQQPPTSTPQPARPSFSCNVRLNATEQRICANPTLAKLDRDMSNTFYSLHDRLSNNEKRLLKSDQKGWLGVRNRCGSNDSCIEGAYFDRIAALNEWEEPGTPSGPSQSFPIAAQSWGGIVRAGPGTNHRKIGSLREGQPITLLADTGVDFNGYRWFQIRWGRRTGYHWGGIICPKGQAVAGTFQVCN